MTDTYVRDGTYCNDDAHTIDIGPFALRTRGYASPGTTYYVYMYVP